MPRIMHTDDAVAYRVVMEYYQIDAAGFEVVTFTQAHGPFSTLGAAKAARTRDRAWSGYQKRGRIERSSIKWEEVQE